MPERQARRAATAGVLLGLVVAAFEGTVVTSAMPTIARSLSGLDLYAWVFTGFLVANVVGVLVFGKLADTFGRRPVFTAGMALFLVGSVLCGTATSMEGLVAFRVLQGFGAGAIAPIAMTITSDLYTLEERARIQALFTSSWGLANVLGPVIGGFLTSRFGWRSVFLVNVPPGALAAVMLLWAYRDPARASSRPSVGEGLRGAVLGGIAAASLLVALEPHEALRGLRMIAIVVAAVATLGFVLDQRRSSSPLLAATVLPDPTVRAGLVAGLFSGGLLYACAAYVPLWITRQGGSPLLAGVALLPLLIGWAFGSSFGVKILVRRGMRASVGGGFLVALVGAVALAIAVRAGASIPVAMVCLGLVGIGLGPAASTSLVAPQNAVAWSQRGAVTSVVYASRALGGSLAIALLSTHAAYVFDGVAAIALCGAISGIRLAPNGAFAGFTGGAERA